jgi:hypothetical protein
VKPSSENFLQKLRGDRSSEERAKPDERQEFYKFSWKQPALTDALLHRGDDMAVSIEAIRAVEVDGLEIHAEPHAGWIHCPRTAASTINNRIDL